MTLSFKTKINGKPTFFVEKILNCISLKNLSEENLSPYFLKTGSAAHRSTIKLHTIRTDKKNRWKKGVMIDFFINARQKNMFRFAPRIPLVSRQKIFMTYMPHTGNGFEVSIDGRQLHKSEVEILAVNDGFDTIQDFEDYFIAQMNDDEYSAKILHWTDLRY